ncbi:MAG TPA: DUF1996 domain-containing protein [Pseudonocardiaceae bacterium]|jgi:hypothetical protein|nr:DUF1996 domain-containing protein [Pseudonocardiaceae bacterium]
MITRLSRRQGRSILAGGLFTVLAAVCAVVLTVTTAPTAAAVGGGGGKFENICYYTHTNQDDAIVFPGQVGASPHLHDYVSNPGANANSTAASLRAGTTNCVNSLDFASYWAPTLFNGSTPIHPNSDTIYYLSNGKSNVKPYPFGLKELAGNPDATSPAQAQDILWGCSTTAPTYNYAPVCSSGAELHVRVDFPDCWNGTTLDSPTHRTHVAYSANGVCPAGYPAPIPMLSILFKYTFSNGKVLKTSAGLGTWSMHADFINAWDVNELAHMVSMCLDPQKVCGRPTGIQ